MKKILLNILFVIMAVYIFIPLEVYADTTIKGDITNKLVLEADSKLFSHLEILNPGDRWDDKIIIKNESDYDYQVSLVEIANNIKDDALYNIVESTITFDDEVIYKGTLNAFINCTEKWIDIKAKNKIVFKVSFYAPDELDNSYQGKDLNAKFVFEARIEELPVDSGNGKIVQTGLNDTMENTSTIFSIMICIGSLIIVILIKRKVDKKYGKN